ncbi:uncharacterized protein LOC121736130 [Aricia agestis]|uniref:uncharacterized protein LOC121736130 n=1 Tax=Aricia agestis TaxID=91739 RepID=UPI001C203359|nr:uncharacterized protein LOC121736130 [Aricia agestis]
MPFKIVETTENGNSLLTTVPANWEHRGTLYWPRKNEAILIKAEDSTPEINWKSMPCIVKRNNIPNYESSEQQIALMSDMSDTDTDQEIIAKTQRPNKTTTQINLNDLVNSCLSENTSDVVLNNQNASIGAIEVIEIPYDQATETTGAPESNSEKQDNIAQKLDQLISVASANEINIQVLFDNQQSILQKLALLDTKLEELVTRILVPVTDFNRQDNNKDNFKIISNLQELTSLEERLNNPQAEENIIKLLSVTCTKGRGRAYNNAYALVDAMFTRQFMTQCSWSGGSRGDPKICFKSYNKTITLFFKIIHQSDNNFTIPDCELFFKKVMRHAIKRNECRMLRASAQKNRPKRVKVLQENNHQSVVEQHNVLNGEQENTPPLQKETNSPLDLTS